MSESRKREPKIVKGKPFTGVKRADITALKLGTFNPTEELEKMNGTFQELKALIDAGLEGLKALIDAGRLSPVGDDLIAEIKRLGRSHGDT